MQVNHGLVTIFSVANMYFNVIRKNKILAKISGFTVYINDNSTDIESDMRFFIDHCVYNCEINGKEDRVKLNNAINRQRYLARKWGMR